MGKLVKIGRHNDNDIVINDPSVSRHHLEIFWDDEGNVFVTDLNSTNGTTINGQRLSGSMLIGRSDIIKIGNVPALPWRTYFTDQVVAAVNSSASQRQGLSGQVDSPVQEQNSYLIHYIVGFLVAALIVVGFFIFKDDLFSSENDKGKDNTSEEQQNESNQNGNQRNGESGDSNDSNGSNDIEDPDKPQPTNKDIRYDYSCMDNQVLNDMNELEKEFFELFDEDVTLNEEVEVGRMLYQGCREEYRFVNDNRLTKITSIKNKLNAKISNKRGFNYKIYLIESPEVNAFTAGGYIFVTTGMYRFAKSDDELACVIGHEMAHNERYHINRSLKRQKVSMNILGDFFGSAHEALEYILNTGFNQKNETECDFYGIDYAVAAGYNACKVIGLWERMSESESTGDMIDEMMSSHPYSIHRSYCCRNHIESNYGFNCEADDR